MTKNIMRVFVLAVAVSAIYSCPGIIFGWQAAANSALNATAEATAVKADKQAVPATVSTEEAVDMKVDFYTIDVSKNDGRGAFVGTVTMTGNKADTSNVTDANLTKLLNGPAQAIAGGKEGNTLYDTVVTYKPTDSKDNLLTFALESYKFGYIADIKKQ
jgi:hypothetical protein